jgi:hypothetical protein
MMMHSAKKSKYSASETESAHIWSLETLCAWGRIIDPVVGPYGGEARCPGKLFSSSITLEKGDSFRTG